MMCTKYQAEVQLKEVYANGFEQEVEQRITDIASFLKKEYRKIRGESITLKVRVRLTLTCNLRPVLETGWCLDAIVGGLDEEMEPVLRLLTNTGATSCLKVVGPVTAVSAHKTIPEKNRRMKIMTNQLRKIIIEEYIKEETDRSRSRRDWKFEATRRQISLSGKARSARYKTNDGNTAPMEKPHAPDQTMAVDVTGEIRPSKLR